MGRQNTQYPEEDLYDALDISDSAKPAEIKAAIRKQRSLYHTDRLNDSLEQVRKMLPRKPGEDEAAYDKRIQSQLTRIIQVINVAYDVLKDPQKRARYDQERQTRTYKVYLDGSKYEGAFQNGEPHGRGKKEYATNDSIYDGMWSKGVFHGQGTFNWSDGSQYKGNWEYGKRHGQGRMTHSTGDVEDGIWTNGQFQGPSQTHSQGPGSHANQGPSNAHNFAGASGGGSGGHHGGHHTSHGSSGGQQPNTYGSGYYKIRPFWLSDLKGFLTKEYGMSGKDAYVKKDFLGVHTIFGHSFGSVKLNISDMGQPDHPGGFWTGNVTLPGLVGRTSLHWDNVWKPGQVRENIERQQNGEDISGGKISANKVSIIGIAVLATLLTIQTPDEGSIKTERTTNGSQTAGKTIEKPPQSPKVTDPTFSSSSTYKRPYPSSLSRNYLKHYADGSKYYGKQANGQRHGKGTMDYADGSQYDGNWENGQRHGKGIMSYADGSQYDGDWKNGKRHGLATFTESNGDQYDGSWFADVQTNSWKSRKNAKVEALNNGRFYGTLLPCRGMMTYTDRRKYTGECKIDKATREHSPVGRGIMLYPDGRQYSGAAFHGTMKYDNGDVYAGEWHRDKKDGRGVMTYSDGSVYTGKWSKDQKYGLSTMKYANGDEYIGEWSNDQKSGEGTMIYANGDEYVGGWSSGQKSGKGTMKYANGDEYDGEWEDGKMHGTGNIIFGKSGDTFHGSWINGKKDGKGTYISADGTVTYQLWESGTQINEQSANNKGIEASSPTPTPKPVLAPERRVTDTLTSIYNFTGKGTYTWPSGDKYAGEWKDGKPHGQGSCMYSDSVEYFGGWKDGKRHGKGTRIVDGLNGVKYEGEWKDGKPHGKATSISSDGDDKYEGEWKDGSFHGRGIHSTDGVIIHYSFTWERESFINGRKQARRGWVQETCGFEMPVQKSAPERRVTDILTSIYNFTGKGTYIFPSGGKYAGEWKGGKRHGQGAYTWSDKKYAGEWEDDKPHGQGTYRRSGLVYHGAWKKGCFNDGTKYAWIETTRETCGFGTPVP